jgi:hypothetical protein
VKKILMLAIVLGVLTVGCASKPLNVRTPPADFSKSCEVLKNVEGSGGGLLFWGIIPIMVNTRFDNAYQEALGKVGGTHLMDVKMVDHWYYIPYVGTLFILNLEGTAIRCQGFAPVEKKKKQESTSPPTSGNTGFGGK